MKNVDGKGAILDFQRKLDAFKAKIRYQQLLAQLLTVEFESLTCEFESLKQLFGVSLEQIESATGNFEATLDNIESISKKIDALSFKFGSSSSKFESTLHKFDASPDQTESTSANIKPTSEKFDASSSNSESTPSNFESTSEQIDALSSVGELASLVRRSAKELKIYFGQPNIPNRLARILLAFGEREQLSVAEMRRITGASRNTVTRDLKILKLLGWIKFHGSRKSGYFTLTDSVPDVISRKGSG